MSKESKKLMNKARRLETQTEIWIVNAEKKTKAKYAAKNEKIKALRDEAQKLCKHKNTYTKKEERSHSGSSHPSQWYNVDVTYCLTCEKCLGEK